MRFIVSGPAHIKAPFERAPRRLRLQLLAGALPNTAPKNGYGERAGARTALGARAQNFGSARLRSVYGREIVQFGPSVVVLLWPTSLRFSSTSP
jgi:hypothetical protein